MSDLKRLLPKLKSKLLEIFIGDEYEEIVLSDHVIKVNGVIYGKLEDIVDDFLVINCFYINKEGELVDGNIVYINSWHVKAITEAKKGSLNDVLLSASHSRKIRQLLGINE